MSQRSAGIGGLPCSELAFHLVYEFGYVIQEVTNLAIFQELFVEVRVEFSRHSKQCSKLIVAGFNSQPVYSRVEVVMPLVAPNPLVCKGFEHLACGAPTLLRSLAQVAP